ncbi:flagellar hook-associated protein FlgK [Blastochloris sulfoviridis]|uniref:Flagellar hook-associated protein 1 n=1 Tax=Blastochloris sulfoviridis TaxID=50712 RepID=A0A5M6I2X7_9HYPH|nr:flagellar hook-associated protein FlgK [Blastochloris sulfoviridis]KAA5602554.1 flagellar hook-associated protein FlgK [Blastochloris sulfoviridis]
MSFSVIRNIATSSLMATSVQVSLTSSNIANADVEGYTRKIATQVATSTAGVGAGTTITGITSKVDKYLVKALVESISVLGAAETKANYADRLQSLFGQTFGGDETGTGTSLGNTLASLETALTNLAATPEGESLQAAVVDQFEAAAIQLRETSRSVQDLRAEADGSIEAVISDVNAALEEISSLNKQIIAAQARGDSTADLDDRRNTALQTVADKMNVSYFTNSAGVMYVYSASGSPLVDSSAHQLSYESVGAVTSSTVFNAITVDGKDITASITSGEIGALIEQRDNLLPAVQDELDELAAKLIGAINAVHNQGTSLPPSSTLTGTKVVDAADALSATGTVRIAVVNEDGTLASYSDLDLTAYATVGDLASAIDGLAGVSAHFDASGHLVVGADASGTGIAINEMTSAVGAGGQGMSSFFGLNDLLTGTNATDINVRADLLATPGLLSSSQLSGAATLTVGSQVVTSGNATIANGLYDTLTDTHAFSAAGRLGSTSTSFSSYAADIISDVAAISQGAETGHKTAEGAQSTLADSLASQAGVNIDEETARLSELEDLYSVATQIIAALNDMFDALLQAARTA